MRKPRVFKGFHAFLRPLRLFSELLSLQERAAHAVQIAQQHELVAQVRREAEMQLREQEHRHRAQLAVEQEL